MLRSVGFDVDPSPLCQASRPEILRLPYLDRSQLAVFWHARERHRMEPLTLCATDRTLRAESLQRLTTRTGYVADLWRGGAGVARSLTVTAPMFRRRVDISMDAFA